MEGRLSIRLETDGGDVSDVRVRSSRPVHAAAAFNGKTLNDVQTMIPLLFSICATAQTCAGVRAMERATGLYASEETERQRACLVNMETLREHLWRILLDWPLLVGDSANKACMAEVVAIQREYHLVLGPESGLFVIGGGGERSGPENLSALRHRMLDLLHRHVFGMPVERWPELMNYGQLVEWRAGGCTASARLMNWIVEAGWSDSGACDSIPLPKLSDAQLSGEMRERGFIEQPQWRGRCCETTSLTRVQSRLLDDLKLRFGNGLLVRLVARLHEVATLARRMVPEPDRGHAPLDCEAARPLIGIGQVAAARGRLVHRVELARGLISDYRILAPTEWNFHPQGVLASALATLRGGAEQIEAQARLLINVIDPCVGYDLVVAAEG